MIIVFLFSESGNHHDAFLPGKASTVSGWGGTKANTPMEPVDQPRQCALKETIINILKPSSKKCSDFIGDSSSTT